MQNNNTESCIKKTIVSIFLALISVICSGKDNGALKFLGIPIDGPESQFASKLKDKGFTYNSLSEGYKGQFNGKVVDADNQPYYQNKYVNRIKA